MPESIPAPLIIDTLKDTFKEARAAQAAGRLVAIPIEVADAIADGANPIKTLRELRGMTQLGLAEAAGLGQGYLSDLEKGRRQGAVATLGNLAQALGVWVEILVDGVRHGIARLADRLGAPSQGAAIARSDRRPGHFSGRIGLPLTQPEASTAPGPGPGRGWVRTGD